MHSANRHTFHQVGARIASWPVNYVCYWGHLCIEIGQLRYDEFRVRYSGSSGIVRLSRSILILRTQPFYRTLSGKRKTTPSGIPTLFEVSAHCPPILQEADARATTDNYCSTIHSGFQKVDLTFRNAHARYESSELNKPQYKGFTSCQNSRCCPVNGH